jgi:hypothetical protein
MGVRSGHISGQTYKANNVIVSLTSFNKCVCSYRNGVEVDINILSDKKKKLPKNTTPVG